MNEVILKRNISGHLAYLSDIVSRENARGNNNVNKKSEDIIAKLLNRVFNYQLKNANDIKKNFPAVDLIDQTNKLSVQVTSTITDIKVTSTCEKFKKHKLYESYKRLIFYFIKDKLPDVRATLINNVYAKLEYCIAFDFEKDFINNVSILDNINFITDVRILTEIESLLAEDLLIENGGKMDPIRGYIIPKKLVAYAGYSLDDLVGRLDILNDINAKFRQSNIVSITGIGGIGKTTIARAYLEKFKNKFDHLAYVDVTTNLPQVLLRRLSTVDKSFEVNPQITILENLENLVQKLSTIYNTVLVIDNANDEIELNQLKYIFEALDWKILITTRVRSNSYLKETIEVNHLNPDELFQLFNNFYQYKNEDEIVIIQNLLAKAHYHTKLIILLAKAARNNPILDLDVLADKVTNNAYQSEELDIIVDINQEENTIYNFILELFKPEDLDGYQKHYMRLFSILPSQEIPINHLYELFEGEKNQGYFINTLNKLVTKGWIEKYSNDYYRIHPLIKLVIQRKLNPTPVECSIIIRNLSYLFDYSLNPISLSIYLSYCEEIVNYFENYIDRKIALLLNKMSWIYRELAQFDQSFSASFNALRIFDNLQQPFSEGKAQTYGNLMTTFTHIGDFKQAIEYGRMCLDIQEAILYPTHPDLLSTYNNLTIVLHKIHHYEDAFININSVVNNLKLVYLKNPNRKDTFNLVNSLTNQAALWADYGRATANESYLRRALWIDFRALIVLNNLKSSNESKLASLYNNISLTYRDLKCYDKSEVFLKKSLDILENVLADDHTTLALGYFNKGVLYERMGLLSKALEFSILALTIQGKHFSPEHENLIATNELVDRLELKLKETL